ncbi:MAG TPA: DUF3303 family protein [Solirubrobacteraceae bacterium]|nr:DUF3303 family protein [Solirubrobacteraceae bacterium]
MKVVIINRPKSAPPLEAMPALIAGVGAWVEKYGPRMEALYFFAAGGGFGVLDVEDSAEVFKMMAEYPFTNYADVEVRAVVGPETAVQALQEVHAAASSAG